MENQKVYQGENWKNSENFLDARYERFGAGTSQKFLVNTEYTFFEFH